MADDLTGTIQSLMSQYSNDILNRNTIYGGWKNAENQQLVNQLIGQQQAASQASTGLMGAQTNLAQAQADIANRMLPLNIAKTQAEITQAQSTTAKNYAESGKAQAETSATNQTTANNALDKGFALSMATGDPNHAFTAMAQAEQLGTLPKGTMAMVGQMDPHTQALYMQHMMQARVNDVQQQKVLQQENVKGQWGVQAASAGGGAGTNAINLAKTAAIQTIASKARMNPNYDPTTDPVAAIAAPEVYSANAKTQADLSKAKAEQQSKIVQTPGVQEAVKTLSDAQKRGRTQTGGPASQGASAQTDALLKKYGIQ